MADFRVNSGGGKKMVIRQGIGELKAGYNMGGDYSRITACSGKNLGLHTGSKSPTFARGGKPFVSR